jgi:hypothetical protein
MPVRCGTMRPPSCWGVMRKPKKAPHTSSKKRTRPLSTRRQLPSRSIKRDQRKSHKRAAAQRATAPTISQDIQKHPGPAEADLRSLRSEIVRQILESVPIPVPQTDADDRKNVVSPSRDVEQRRPFLPSSVFASGVNAITIFSTISMELVSLVLRSTERSLGAIQTLMRCRTPGEFVAAYSDLLRANLNDAFEGAEKVLRQTRR